jgi:hypothetical protein
MENHKFKPKPFTNNSVNEAIFYLQAVTPTDAKNGFYAHWWNEPLGQHIKSVQLNFIEMLKTMLVNSKTKDELKNIFDEIKYFHPIWPINLTPKEFWVNGFGWTIIGKWEEMFKKFSDKINSFY